MTKTCGQNAFIVWADADAEPLSYACVHDGDEDALREPTQWGVDECVVIALQRITREVYEQLRTSDDWKVIARKIG